MLVPHFPRLGPWGASKCATSIHPEELGTVRRVLNSRRMAEPSKTSHIGPQLRELPDRTLVTGKKTPRVAFRGSGAQGALPGRWRAGGRAAAGSPLRGGAGREGAHGGPGLGRGGAGALVT